MLAALALSDSWYSIAAFLVVFCWDLLAIAFVYAFYYGAQAWSRRAQLGLKRELELQDFVRLASARSNRWRRF